MLVSSAAAASKPDLVVRGFQLTPASGVGANGPPHALIDADGSYRVRVEYGVRNDGGKAARASTARVSNVTHRSAHFKIADTAISRLPPGSRQDVRGVLQDQIRQGTDAIDVLLLQVCADARDKVAESNEANNCSPFIDLKVIPERWLVTQWSTLASFGPIRKTEMSGHSPFFEYSGYDDSTREFTYSVTGSVRGSSTGMLGSCQLSGGGSTSYFDPWAPPDGYPAEFRIAGDLKHYIAQLNPSYLTYTETASCPGGSGFSEETPYQLLTTNSASSFLIPVPDSGNSTLKKSYAQRFQSGQAYVWRWTFDAVIP